MTSNHIAVLMISKALVVGAYHSKVEAMVRSGAIVHLVTPKAWGNQKAEIWTSDLYVIHHLPVAFSGKNHLHFYLHLRKLIESVRPDLIHIDEESYSFVTFQAMRLAVKHKIPALFFNWQNIEKKYPCPFSFMERYVMKNAAAGIAGSQEAKDILLRKGCRAPLHVIPQFGVDPKKFAKKSNPNLRKSIIQSSKAFVVGFAGRLVAEKGIDDLVKACAELPASLHLVLIGEGPFEKESIRLANLCGMSARFHVVRSVRSTEMPQYLNMLDCLVLPSRTRRNWKEQFGRVLIEAMACEVPVVGSSSGEIPSVIGAAGKIFPEGNIVALREILSKLMTDGTLRSELGKAGRRRVEDHFSQQRVAEDTIKVYKSVVQEHCEDRH